MKELITQVIGAVSAEHCTNPTHFQSRWNTLMKLESCRRIQMYLQNIVSIFKITLITVSSHFTESEWTAGWQCTYEGRGVRERGSEMFLACVGEAGRMWGSSGWQVAGAERQEASERHTLTDNTHMIHWAAQTNSKATQTTASERTNTHLNLNLQVCVHYSGSDHMCIQPPTHVGSCLLITLFTLLQH